MSKDFTCPKSGVRIPLTLMESVVDADGIVPNPWNPNSMEGFMREKLIHSIRTDGFFVPIIVRPLKGSPDMVEIIDGEHRYKVGVELGMTQFPVVNLGAISDEKAKSITVKANSLRGEFDSIRLGQLTRELVDSIGKDQVLLDLPYTPERIDSLLSLTATDLNNLTIPGTDAATGESEAAPAPKTAAETFPTFTPTSMKFDVKCPRCGFEHNLPDKTEAAETAEA